MITGPLDGIDIRAAIRLFPGVKPKDIKRPVGKVHLLIGIHQASIFPQVEDKNKHIRGNLRMLKSIFGTGKLLDGSHPDIKIGQMMRSCNMQSFLV